MSIERCPHGTEQQPTCYVCHFRSVDPPTSDRLEAEAAAMREALEQRGCEEAHVDKNGALWCCSSETPMDPCRTCRALASDAGKAVLERLAKAERIANSARPSDEWDSLTRRDALEAAAQVAESLPCDCTATYCDRCRVAVRIRAKAKEGT